MEAGERHDDPPLIDRYINPVLPTTRKYGTPSTEVCAATSVNVNIPSSDTTYASILN